MIIDTHVHVWALDDAPGHRPAAGALVKAPSAAVPVEWLLEDMERFSIDHCVLVQSSAFGADNTYMVECLDRYPNRFKAVGLVDPLDTNSYRDLEKWMARGLSGFRFHPLYYDDPRWVDAPSSDRLWSTAAEYGAIFQFHLRPEHAESLARMMRRHPELRVIVDHLGKPDVTEGRPYPSFQPVLRLADLPNAFAKIGDYQIASHEAYPWRDTWPFVSLLKQHFGPERMLWGTGYAGPARLVPLEQALRYVQVELPLTAADRQAILWDTPARLFGFRE